MFDKNRNMPAFEEMRQKFKFSTKSSTFSCFDMRSEPMLLKSCSERQTCSRLLELQEVASNVKSCSKVAEHNGDVPS